MERWTASRDLLATIVNAQWRAQGREVGGVLWGDWAQRRIAGGMTVENISAEPEREYIPHPEKWASASTDYIWAFLGGWHTHPRFGPEASAADLATAETMGLLLIFAPSAFGGGQGWRLYHPATAGEAAVSFRFDRSDTVPFHARRFT